MRSSSSTSSPFSLDTNSTPPYSSNSFPSSDSHRPRSTSADGFHTHNQPFRFPSFEPDLDPQSAFGETTYTYAFLPPGHMSSIVPGSSSAIPGSVSAEDSVRPFSPSILRPDKNDASTGSGDDEDYSEGSPELTAKDSDSHKKSEGWSSVVVDPGLAGPDEDSGQRAGEGSQAEQVKHRRRTSRFQFTTLEETFATNPKPTAIQRSELGLKLDMSPRAVQVWFQNRRAKVKTQAKKAAGSQAKGLPAPPRNASVTYPADPPGLFQQSEPTSASGAANDTSFSLDPSDTDSFFLADSSSNPSGNLSQIAPNSIGGFSNVYRRLSNASPLSVSNTSWEPDANGSSQAGFPAGLPGPRYSSVAKARHQTSMNMSRRQSMPGYGPSTEPSSSGMARSSSGQGISGAEALGSRGHASGGGVGPSRTVRRFAPADGQDRRGSLPSAGSYPIPSYPEHYDEPGASSSYPNGSMSSLPPPPNLSNRTSLSTPSRHPSTAPYDSSLSSRRASLPAQSPNNVGRTPPVAFYPPPMGNAQRLWNLTPIEDQEGDSYLHTPKLDGMPTYHPQPSFNDGSYNFASHSYPQAQHSLYHPHPPQFNQEPAVSYRPPPSSQQQQHYHYHHHQQQQQPASYVPGPLPDSSFSFGSISADGRTTPTYPLGTIDGYGYPPASNSDAKNPAWPNPVTRRESAPAQLLEDFSSMSVLAMNNAIAQGQTFQPPASSSSSPTGTLRINNPSSALEFSNDLQTNYPPKSYSNGAPYAFFRENPSYQGA